MINDQPLTIVIDGRTIPLGLDSAEPLVRAVVISLFTWRRANPDDDLPGDLRMGWWGDSFPTVADDRIGSRLWLLRRVKLTRQTQMDAEFYAREALQWLEQHPQLFTLFGASLLVPQPARERLWTLYALNHDLARAPLQSNEPLIAMMRLRLPMLREALSKAEQAYGPAVRRDLGRAIDRLAERTGWLERCMQAMAMQMPKAVLWQKVRALRRVVPDA